MLKNGGVSFLVGCGSFMFASFETSGSFFDKLAFMAVANLLIAIYIKLPNKPD